MTTTINLKNLRAGDVIAKTDYKGIVSGEWQPCNNAGKPQIVKAITLPFIYTENGEVIDTREYKVIRVTRKAL